MATGVPGQPPLHALLHVAWLFRSQRGDATTLLPIMVAVYVLETISKPNCAQHKSTAQVQQVQELQIHFVVSPECFSHF